MEIRPIRPHKLSDITTQQKLGRFWNDDENRSFWADIAAGSLGNIRYRLILVFLRPSALFPFSSYSGILVPLLFLRFLLVGRQFIVVIPMRNLGLRMDAIDFYNADLDFSFAYWNLEYVTFGGGATW